MGVAEQAPLWVDSGTVATCSLVEEVWAVAPQMGQGGHPSLVPFSQSLDSVFPREEKLWTMHLGNFPMTGSYSGTLQG